MANFLKNFLWPCSACCWISGRHLSDPSCEDVLIQPRDSDCFHGSARSFDATGLAEDALSSLRRLREAGLVQEVTPSGKAGSKWSKRLDRNSAGDQGHSKEKRYQLTPLAGTLFQALPI